MLNDLYLLNKQTIAPILDPKFEMREAGISPAPPVQNINNFLTYGSLTKG